MYEVNDVAKWFLSRDNMTPKKLQKLVYYSYAWYLVLNNEPNNNLENKLFNDKIEAWVHGPVVPSLDGKYKHFRHNEIKREDDNSKVFDIDTLDLLRQIWDIYGDYNGNELESITHQERPWKEARKGYEPLEICQEVIRDETMYEYYLTR